MCDIWPPLSPYENVCNLLAGVDVFNAWSSDNKHLRNYLQCDECDVKPYYTYTYRHGSGGEQAYSEHQDVMSVDIWVGMWWGEIAVSPRCSSVPDRVRPVWDRQCRRNGETKELDDRSVVRSQSNLCCGLSAQRRRLHSEWLYNEWISLLFLFNRPNWFFIIYGITLLTYFTLTYWLIVFVKFNLFNESICC